MSLTDMYPGTATEMLTVTKEKPYNASLSILQRCRKTLDPQALKVVFGFCWMRVQFQACHLRWNWQSPRKRTGAITRTVPA